MAQSKTFQLKMTPNSSGDQLKASSPLVGGAVGAMARGSQKPTSQDYIDDIIDEERSTTMTHHTVSTREPVKYKGNLEKQMDSVRGIPGNAFNPETNENLQVGGGGHGSRTPEGYSAVRSADKKK